MRDPIRQPETPRARMSDRLRRRRVRIPVVPRADALFLALRRMRAPLLILVGVYVVATIGLVLTPGRDAAGNVVHLSVFDAFYFVSYTATTIGFGEINHPFTPAQRLWTSVTIYMSVLAWTYTFGTLFQLMQDSAFRTAMARQRFTRRIRAFREKYVIIAGYGHTGRMIAQALDDRGERLVVLDRRQERIDTLESDQLVGDVPGLAADPGILTTLGMAGLGNPRCRAVLAMTEDDSQNLAIVMAARLLQPGIRAIARASSRAAADEMELFGPEAVINPYDRYGTYLVVALHRPTVYRLVSWLLDETGEELPSRHDGLADGPWVVLCDDEFGREVARDLQVDGLEVTLVTPGDEYPDLTGVVGFVAGTASDSVNLAAAARVRLGHPSIFLSVRHYEHNNRMLAAAFEPDSVFAPNELVVSETLARMVSPGYWAFIEHVLRASDAEAQAILDLLVARMGTESPDHGRVTIAERDTPAVRRWLRSRSLTIGDLLRDPDDREKQLSVVVVEMLRSGVRTILPPEDLELRPGDKLVYVGRPEALSDLGEAMYDDSTLQYLVTGRDVPTSLVWRLATGRVLTGDQRDVGGDL
jgi:voltage-gated potassium channel